MTALHPSPSSATPGDTSSGGPAPVARPDVRPGSAPRRWRDERLHLALLLLGTAALYLIGLGASGWANSFYAAAAQAGSDSWSAFFYGASDAAGSITVDKPPLALWPMALSVRIFGLSSWSLLVPQALMGVATVWLVHRMVRRVSGSAALALLAGVTLAVTPVAVLMFRFNNPDALLVLLLTAATSALVRALDTPERARRWLALSGTLLGLAFLTKTLQAFLVLPGFALTYALFAAWPWRRRLADLLLAFGAMLVAGGWWVAVVELVPASARPYIGGSQNDSFLELTFGYNGLGRITGEETGSVGGGQGGGWGTTGLFRLLGAENGGQIAWLLPAALVLGLVACLRGPRLQRVLATAMLGWLVVTALTFSLMAGIYHAYYTVALAPAIAVLVALGAGMLWRSGTLAARGLLAAVLAGTCSLAWTILARTPDWHPWLRAAVLLSGVVLTVLVVASAVLPHRMRAAVALAALITALAAPTASALTTAATPHTGSIPTAGPSGGAMVGGRPGTGGMPTGLPGGMPTGMPTGLPGGMPDGMPGGGLRGLLESTEPSTALVGTLLDDADSYTWVAATVGANNASGYQLATQRSVMPIGGFNGSDPSPTLAQFQRLVADGEIHYFIPSGLGGGMGGMGGRGGDDASSTASLITAWVSATFTAVSVDGTTLYDLTSPL